MKCLIKNIFFFFLLVLVINSCKKDDATAPDIGYSYFPLNIGSYIVYDVDSIFYDDFNNKIDTFKFQLKHKIESSFIDNEGRTAYRVERYIKKYNSLIPYNQIAWTLRDVWIANKTATTAEQVEENVRYIKIAFPIKDQQSWNGNAQNTFDPWDYSYNFIDLPRTLGGTKFDSVMEVNQFDDEGKNLFKREYFIERYARNVGMIYKKVINVESQPEDGWSSSQIQQFLTLPILERVTSGYQYTYTINSYGFE